MILTKMVINAVADKLAKHFRLDKIMSYVFDDNNLIFGSFCEYMVHDS